MFGTQWRTAYSKGWINSGGCLSHYRIINLDGEVLIILSIWGHWWNFDWGWWFGLWSPGRNECWLVLEITGKWLKLFLIEKLTWKVLVTQYDPETKKWKENQKYESGKKKKININIIFILNQKKIRNQTTRERQISGSGETTDASKDDKGTNPTLDQGE